MCFVLIHLPGGDVMLYNIFGYCDINHFNCYFVLFMVTGICFLWSIYSVSLPVCIWGLCFSNRIITIDAFLMYVWSEVYVMLCCRHGSPIPWNTLVSQLAQQELLVQVQGSLPELPSSTNIEHNMVCINALMHIVHYS